MKVWSILQKTGRGYMVAGIYQEEEDALFIAETIFTGNSIRPLKVEGLSTSYFVHNKGGKVIGTIEQHSVL